MLKAGGIEVPYISRKTLRKTPSKTKKTAGKTRTNVVHQTECRNCEQRYIGQRKDTISDQDREGQSKLCNRKSHNPEQNKKFDRISGSLVFLRKTDEETHRPGPHLSTNAIEGPTHGNLISSQRVSHRP